MLEGSLIVRAPRTTVTAAVVLLAGMVCGCSEEDRSVRDAGAPVPAELERSSAKVTAATGGEMTTTTGMRITFPPGALAADTEVTVVVTEAQVPGYDAASPVYEFGPPGLIFAEPVTITVPSAAGAGYVVYWSTLDDPGRYEPVPTESGDGAKIGLVRHFSKGFVGANTGGDCADVTCPPEPSVCINSVQLSVSGEGACVSGACVYPKDTVKCAGNKGGAGCVDGACALSCSGTVLNGVTVTDCDGSALNGCEAVMATDPKHCGFCGKTCGAGEACSGGFCVATGSCRIALDCVGSCVQAGSAVDVCFTDCGGTVSGADADAYAAVRDCLLAACAADLTDACGSAAIKGQCAAQAIACKGPDPDACTTDADCVSFGGSSICDSSGHCAIPSGTPCTEATKAVDCATFGVGANCVSGLCQSAPAECIDGPDGDATCTASHAAGWVCSQGTCQPPLAACIDGPDGDATCTASHAAGWICSQGTCHSPPPECADGPDGDAACQASHEAGWVCSQGACHAPPPECVDGPDGDAACQTSHTAGWVCSQGACLTATACADGPVGDEACVVALGLGWSCVAGLCQAMDVKCVDGPGGDDACATAQGSGWLCKDNTCTPPPPVPCSSDSECISAKGPIWFCGASGVCDQGQCGEGVSCPGPNDVCENHGCAQAPPCTGEGTPCPASAKGFGLVCVGGSCELPPCAAPLDCSTHGGKFAGYVDCYRTTCTGDSDCTKVAGSTCVGFQPETSECVVDHTDCTTTGKCPDIVATCDFTQPVPGVCEAAAVASSKLPCLDASACLEIHEMCLDSGTPADPSDDYCHASYGPCSTAADCPVWEHETCQGASLGTCKNGGGACNEAAACGAQEPIPQQCQTHTGATLGMCSLGVCITPSPCSSAGGCAESDAEPAGLVCEMSPCELDAQCGPLGSCVSGTCADYGACTWPEATCADVLAAPSAYSCLAWQLAGSPDNVVEACAPSLLAVGERANLTALVTCIKGEVPPGCDAECVKASAFGACAAAHSACAP